MAGLLLNSSSVDDWAMLPERMPRGAALRRSNAKLYKKRRDNKADERTETAPVQINNDPGQKEAKKLFKRSHFLRPQEPRSLALEDVIRKLDQPNVPASSQAAPARRLSKLAARIKGKLALPPKKPNKALTSTEVGWPRREWGSHLAQSAGHLQADALQGRNNAWESVSSLELPSDSGSSDSGSSDSGSSDSAFSDSASSDSASSDSAPSDLFHERSLAHLEPFDEARVARQTWAAGKRSQVSNNALLQEDAPPHATGSLVGVGASQENRRGKGKMKQRAIRTAAWVSRLVEADEDPLGATSSSKKFSPFSSSSKTKTKTPVDDKVEPNEAAKRQKKEPYDAPEDPVEAKLIALQGRLSQLLAETKRHNASMASLALQEQAYWRQIQGDGDAKKARKLQDQENYLYHILAEQQECVCCGDTKQALDFPAAPTTSTCQHPPQTCTECMHTWLDSELTCNGSTSLKCPECPQKLSHDDIQRLATPSTFTAYEALLTRTTLGKLEEFAWCLAPNCGSGQLNIDNSNYMDCANCGYKQCLEHKCAWHFGETCGAYSYRTSGQKARDEEAATEKLIGEVSKKCPGPLCGWRIQKRSGCDHMTCKQCMWQFCWECLASHEKIKRVGNTAHERWCKFHSDNLDVTWPFNAHR